VEYVDAESVCFGCVDAGGLEDLADDGGPVGSVFGQGLAGPFPGDQDPPSAQPQVFTVVSLAGAVSGDQSGARVLWLDSVTQPVRALRGTRQVSQLCVQPVDVRLIRLVDVFAVRVGVGLSHGLGQVLGQVAHGAVSIGAAAVDALDVELGPEPHHMHRPGVLIGVQGVESFTPRRQWQAGVRVAVALSFPVPDREPVDVHVLVEGRPPDLQVGALGDRLDHLPGNRTAQGGVQVRGQAPLWFDAGEVLDLVTGSPAQVLDPPVHELGEVQRIQRRAPVVIPTRVHRDPAAGNDLAVRRQGEGDEHRGPVLHPRGCGERAPYRAVLNRDPWQVGHVLASPGRPHPPIPLILVVRLVLVLVVFLEVEGVGFFGFVVAVPSFGALGYPQPAGFLRARWAARLNAGQAALVRAMATSGARLQLAIAPAGAGKTTAMRALAGAWTEGGGTVVGLAPSAAAAAALREQIGASTDTLAKLTWSLEQEDLPGWAQQIGPSTLVVIDEAGMADTLSLDAAVEFIVGRGGSVRLIGDDQQLATIGAGGVLRDIQATHGAARLSELLRFADPAEGAASLALREGQTEALGFYLDSGRVHVGDLATMTEDVFTAWQADRGRGLDSIMLAPTRELVSELNQRARAHRLGQEQDPAGTPSGPAAHLGDGNEASIGELIITRSNDRTLRTSSTDWVKNGDRWMVLGIHDGGDLSVQHTQSGRTVRLPADYVQSATELGYATTVHTAQGVSVDTMHPSMRMRLAHHLEHRPSPYIG
jgi:hypothetical protein